jgi:hypothetical protein
MSLLHILSTLFFVTLLNFNQKHLINSQSTSTTTTDSSTTTSISTITTTSTTITTTSATSTTTTTQYVSFFLNIFTLPVPNSVLPLGSTALIYCQYNTSDPTVGWYTTINGTLVDINSEPRYSIVFYTDENSLNTWLLKIEHLTQIDHTYIFSINLNIGINLTGLY